MIQYSRDFSDHMDYLPSKNFLFRVLALFLLFGGWFFFSGNNAGGNSKINNKNIGTVEKNGGSLVFSKNQEKGNTSKDLSLADEWKIENDNAGNNSINFLSAKNTANVSKTNIQNIPQFKPYKQNYLNIISGEGKEDIKKYAQNLVLAIKPYSLKNLPNEGYLAMQAIMTGNTEDLEKIAIMGQIHKVVSETLLEMEVPKEIAGLHLSLLNNTAKISFIDSVLAEAFENSSFVMSFVNDYKRETDSLVSNINKINKFFSDKNIQFGPDEKIRIYINNIE